MSVFFIRSSSIVSDGQGSTAKAMVTVMASFIVAPSPLYHNASNYFADVNGDGRDDWILVSKTTNEGWVGLGTADGDFQRWNSYSTGRGATNAHTHYFADVNGDGMADWVQVSKASSNAWLGLATGAGNVQHWTHHYND